MTIAFGKPLDRGDWVRASILFVATAVVFWPATELGFTGYDDPVYVSANPQVAAGLARESMLWAFTTHHASNWHPLTWLSLQLDTDLWGRDPAGYHRTSVLLHALNAALAYIVLRRASGVAAASAIAAALFALHPLRVESVVWISERKDVLSGCFGLLTIWAYLRYAESPSWGRWIVVGAALAAGLAAKPMLVTWPCVLMLLDFWPLRRIRSRADIVPCLREKWLLFALAIASSLITVQVQHAGGAVRDVEDVPLVQRVANVPVAYLTYLRMIVIPVDLAVLYPLRSWPLWQVAGATLAAGMLTWIAWRRRNEHPYALFGWLWFVGTLVPVIGLVQVGSQAYADRYTYLPQLGIVSALVWSAAAAAAHWRVSANGTTIAAVAILAAVIILSRRQMGHWQNDRTLWERDLAVEPAENPVAHNNLGTVYFAEARYSDALKMFSQACQENPNLALYRTNRASVLNALGRFEEAERDARLAITLKMTTGAAAKSWFVLAETSRHASRFEQAEREYLESLRHEDNAPARNNLGTLLIRLDRHTEAIPHLQAARDLDPANPDANYNLGFALIQSGQWDAAIPFFQAAATLQPRSVRYQVILATALCAVGRRQEAESSARAASRIDPGWCNAYLRTAWGLATDPDSRRRRGDIALAMAEAIRLVAVPPSPQLLDAQAAAHAELQHFNEARTLALEAIASAERTGQRDLVVEIQKRLARYAESQPYREPPRP